MQSTVLIAILNWGLGHATRSMPVIDAFLAENYIVHIASDGEALTFLRKEYPELKFHILPGYKIKYTHHSIFLNVLKSSVSILKAIYQEKRIVKSIVKETNPRLIVSDNRYGVRSKVVKSILVTHQLKIRLNNSILSGLGTGFIRFLVRRFDEIWIPDSNGKYSLSGELSDAESYDNVKYLGPVSRFSPMRVAKKYDVAVVLSGPEPQRSVFEKIILSQLGDFKLKVVVVRGKVEDDEDYFLNNNVEVKGHLLSKELNLVLNQSEIVISRSGYTTIMDLAVLGKKAILVPTPGQTEQEYLAEYLREKKCFYSCRQDEFDIEDALQMSRNYNGISVNNTNNLREFISRV